MFSRSELRRSIIDAALVNYADLNRPRVKKWVRCAVCHVPEAKSYCVVDHKDPIIPVDRSFEQMSLDEVVDRMWCDPINLQAICPSCHDEKSKQERKQRTKNKKDKKNELKKRETN